MSLTSWSAWFPCRLTWMAVLCLACLLSGCRLANRPVTPFSSAWDAEARAELAGAAHNDPFPTAAEAGL